MRHFEFEPAVDCHPRSNVELGENHEARVVVASIAQRAATVDELDLVDENGDWVRVAAHPWLTRSSEAREVELSVVSDSCTGVRAIDDRRLDVDHAVEERAQAIVHGDRAHRRGRKAIGIEEFHVLEAQRRPHRVELTDRYGSAQDILVQ